MQCPSSELTWLVKGWPDLRSQEVPVKSSCNACGCRRIEDFLISITVKKKKKNLSQSPHTLKKSFLECLKSINIISPLNTSVKSILFFGHYNFIKIEAIQVIYTLWIRVLLLEALSRLPLTTKWPSLSLVINFIFSPIMYAKHLLPHLTLISMFTGQQLIFIYRGEWERLSELPKAT